MASVNDKTLDPTDVFQDHFADLSESIGTATNFERVIGRIYSQKLISQAIYDDITTTTGESAYQKSRRLVRELQRQIQSSNESDQKEMLLKICDVLLNFDDLKLKEIAVEIRSQLGVSEPLDHETSKLPSPRAEVTLQHPMIKRDPSDIFRTQSAKLCDAIESDPVRIASCLNAKRLIAPHVLKDVSSGRFGTDYEKANKIVSEIQRQLDAYDDPDQFLTKICNFLKDDKDETIRKIGIAMINT